MQDKIPRDRRVPYTGRFADPGEAAPARRYAGARPAAGDAQPRAARTAPRAAGTTIRDAYAQSRATSERTQPQRRPSGFAAPEEAKRRPAVAPQADDSNAARAEKPKRFPRLFRRSGEARGDNSPTKRSQVKKHGWLKKLLIALGILLALALLLALIFGRGDETYHQLPKIERGGDSAYEPEQGAESGAAETGDAEYLVNPGADSEGGSGDVDWSQYLVTPEPGADLSQAAAAAGASLDAATSQEDE